MISLLHVETGVRPALLRWGTAVDEPSRLAPEQGAEGRRHGHKPDRSAVGANPAKTSRTTVNDQSGDGPRPVPMARRASTRTPVSDTAPVHTRPLGRRAECDRLDQVVAAVSAGHSSTLVLRGEAGIGKSVLLDYLAGRASAGAVVLRASGVESEMELPFAGLHQLCMPILDRVPLLPELQRDALHAALGVGSGVANRLAVALGGLDLLSGLSETRPLFCVIDDAQWLDQASVQTLFFIARRLLAERIGMVFAVRDDTGALAGLPELEVTGLRDQDASLLLGSVIGGRLDPRVRQRIVAETHGNPLAIIQLPRGLSGAELSAGLGPSVGVSLPNQIKQSFLGRYRKLPNPTRQLLMLAAAEPLGDPNLLWRAAAAAGLPDTPVSPADTGGLMSIGQYVQFEHPLARAAIYDAATGQERQAAHRAIAQATDPETDPDHRAWHRSQAATGTDDEVAAELEYASGRALARGGLAAAAAILERSTQLSSTRPEVIRRGLTAARATYDAGAPDRAVELLTVLESGSLGPAEHAAVIRLRGQIAVSHGQPAQAAGLLLNAAQALQPFDPAQARETYLEALEAVHFAGQSGFPGGLAALAADVIRTVPAPPDQPGLVDHLLDGMLTWAVHGLPDAIPAIRRALAQMSSASTDPAAAARWVWLMNHMANSTWDDDLWMVITDRYRAVVREIGALSLLPSALMARASYALTTGDFAATDSLLSDASSISTAVGLPPAAGQSRAALTAWQGQREETETVLAQIVRDRAADGDYATAFVDGCTAVLNNGLGNYALAFRAAQRSAFKKQLGFPEAMLLELIESAVRLDEPAEAKRALQHLTVRTTAAGTSWALGVEAYCRALLTKTDAAESYYRQAIEQLDTCRIVPFRHRARLVFGEWLRRERRRTEAREHLQVAYETFIAMGALGFAERARRELLATGGTVPRRTEDTRDVLTPQEVQVAQLAAAEASNQEIAAQLFISSSTVSYHLSKAFRKLGINSRRELARALASP